MSRDPAAMQGFRKDRKVTIDAEAWESLQRMIWRMKVSWGFVEKEALDLLGTCRHVDGCRGVVETTEPCKIQCPDRQLRSSALVFLANAREFSRVSGRKPERGYFPPTREFFDALVSDLAAAEAELRERPEHVTQPELPEVPSLPPSSEET